MYHAVNNNFTNREIDTGCKYLWKFKQGFCWSYCPLFNADGSFIPGASTNLSFARIKSTHSDKEACEYILKSLQKTKTGKKLSSSTSSGIYPMGPIVKKPILGDFVFDFALLKPESSDASDQSSLVDPCLDPSLLPLKQSLPPNCDTLQVATSI